MSPVPIVRPSLILRHALKAKAVIAHAEDSKKTPTGVLEQLRKELESMGVEFEGPKPFCALEKTGKPIIDSFVDLGFGKPVLRIETSPDGKMFMEQV
jgi:thymidylate synthase